MAATTITAIAIATIALLTIATGCKTRTKQSTDLSPAGLQKAVEESGFATYTNERFGFKLKYPKCFEMTPPPENGDGREFIWGDVSLTAYGCLNIFNDKAEDRAAQDSTSIYRNIVGNSYTSSGTTADGLLYYQKEVLIDDTWYTSVLRYPKEYEDAIKDIKEKSVDGFLERD